MFERILDFESILERKSLFLLGPRQSGKSTYLKKKYPRAYSFDLLDSATFLKFKTQPALFGEEIEFQILKNKKHIFVVDEIQKAPELLDGVHRLIETHKKSRFILTGSSARKLKRSGVNLLGGRASRIHFHPIVSVEYGFQKYEKEFYRNALYGFMPSILTSKEPWNDLEDYVSLYLKEEIQQEALVRSIAGFGRFLNAVATTNAQQLNFTDLANDVQVPPRTVREYYQVLEDTLVGHLLPAFEKTVKRKAISTAKFYLFDPGVTNFLLGRQFISPKTTEFGAIFEQTIFCEIKAYLDYHAMADSLFYWRSTSQFEVDFLVRNRAGHWVAIEVKSSATPSKKDYKGILALEEDLKLKKRIVVCLAQSPRLAESKIDILPYRLFLEMLWAGEIV